MRTFNDSAGRMWSVAVNVTAVEEVKAHADVDLLELVEGGGLLERLMRNPVLLCRVLYALCRGEMEAKNVAAEDFGRAMAGRAITDARQALLEEIVDFFHQEGPTIRREAEKLLGAYEKLLEAVNLRLDGLDEGELVERALAAAAASLTGTSVGASSGGSPESSASPPAR